MRHYIYKITNTKNGKIYIGITSKSLEWRVKKHFLDSRRLKGPFYKDILLFNKICFLSELICKTNSKSLACMLEKMFINYYNSAIPNGYNVHKCIMTFNTTYAKIRFSNVLKIK